MSTLKVVRFTYVPLPAFVEVDDANGVVVFDGFMPAMIMAIAKWMKFKPIFIEEPDGIFGSEDENGVWDGMHGMIARNEADISMSGMSPEANFFEYGTVSNPVTIEKYSMLAGKKVQEAGFFLFFNIFQIEVWTGTLISLVLLASAITAVCQKLPEIPKRRRRWHKILPEYFWTFFAYMMQQGADKKWTMWNATSRLGWLIPMLMMCWIIGVAFLIMNVFQSGLLSLLTVQKSVPLVDTIRDVIEKPKITVVATQGMELHMVLEHSGIAILDSLWDRVKGNLIENDAFFSDETLTKTEEGKYCLIHGYLIFESELDERFRSTGQCNFHIASETFTTISLVCTIRQSLPQDFKEKFNYGITRLVDADIPGKWFKRIGRGAELCQKYLFKELKPLDLKNIYGVLVLWAAGLGVAVLVCCLEIFFAKRDKKTSKRRRNKNPSTKK